MSDMSQQPLQPSLDDFSLPNGPPSPTLQSPHEPTSDFGPPSAVSDLTGAPWTMPSLFSDGDDYGYTAAYDYPAMSTTYPQYPKLHHSASTTSLSSIGSNYSGLYVNCPPDTARVHGTMSTSHSRQSSFSSVAGLDKISPQPSWSGFHTAVPKLHVQTQRLGRIRSDSRVAPYDRRERSESLSVKSEADDLSSLVNTTSSLGGYQTPLTSIGQPLNRLTLHHRRSSSNVTSFSPTNPMLSRKHRSSSILTHPKRSSVESVRLRGSAADREDTVRQLLHAAAEEMRSLPSVSQQDKAKSAWVKKWLQLSYTTSPGHTVPRQGLYASYAASSEEYGVRAINSASFGKAVRNAFQGIKTRRLGVRGNSKYHYIALRPAISIEAERLNRFGDSSGQWHVAPSDGTMTFHSDLTDDDAEMEELEDSEDEDDEHVFAFERSQRPGYGRRHTTSDISSPFSSVPMMPTPVYDLPGFPVITGFDLGPGVSVEAAYEFWNAFCRHQELLVSSIRNQHYDRFDANLHEFWGLLIPAWVQVCHHPVISRMVADGMALTYNHLVFVLTSTLQQPLSSTAQQTLRALAGRLESCVEACLSVFARDFADTKVELAVRAAHLLNRCVDIHQLSAALLPIISNHSQVADMVDAWDQLDMKSISDQCALSCDCEQAMIERVLHGFRDWLSASTGGRAITKLGQWVDEMVVEAKQGRPASKGLVTRAGFLTSQIMRDFTLKSASCFGFFQLVKTWIDDWISISVLRPSVLSPQSATSSPTTGGMSVMIPRQNHLELSEENLATAVPAPFHDSPHSHRRTASSSFPTDYSTQPNHFTDLTALANLSVSSNSSSTGFMM